MLATVWLPPGLHVKATLWLHVALSIALMACMLTREGKSRSAALTGGVVFGYSGFAIGHMYGGHLLFVEVMPFFPLVYWASGVALRKDGLGWTLLWAISLSLAGLSGHFQAVYMLVTSLLVYHTTLVLGGSRRPISKLDWRNFWRGEAPPRPCPDAAYLLAPDVAWAERGKDLARLIVGWLVAGGLALGLNAFQLLPTLTSLSQSDRISRPDAYATGDLPASFWLTALMPQFFDGSKDLLWWSRWPNMEAQMYLGIGALTWLALALFQYSWRRWLPPLVVLVLAAVLTLGPITPLHGILTHLDPFLFKNFRGSCRFGLVVTFFAAWLVALGIDSLPRARPWWALLMPGLPLAIVAGWLGSQLTDVQGWLVYVRSVCNPDYWDLLTHSQNENHVHILERGLGECVWAGGLCLLLCGIGYLPARHRVRAALVLTVFDLGWLGQRYLIMVPAGAIGLPPALQRPLAQELGCQRIMWNPNKHWLGHGSLAGLSEVSSYDSISHPAYKMAVNLLNGVPAESPRLLIEPWSNHPFWNLQGAALIVNDRPAPPWDGLIEVDRSIGLYRNPKAFDRMFMVGKTIWSLDKERTIQSLVKDPDLGRSVAFVDYPSQPPCSDSQPVYTVSQEHLEPNRVTGLVTNQSPGMLVVSDGWWPGWTVQVDGRREVLYRVNGGLHRGVWLKPGKHLVEFVYWPSSLTGGLTVSALTGCLLAICFLGSRVRTQSTQN